MKKIIAALALSGLTVSAAFAQAPDAKLEWATKVVALQQGPELQRLVEQLADSATQEILQNWGPKLQTNVPQARQEKASAELNAELKTYYADVSKIINGKVIQVSNSALIPAYVDRFSLDELKQIASFFESPVIKKYQAAAPELGNIFAKELVEATRADVTARVRQFDEKAAKIVGTAPAAAPSSKAPAKK
jgi:hypothetical protein